MNTDIHNNRRRIEGSFLNEETRDKKVAKLRARGWKVKVWQEWDTSDGNIYWTYYFYRASKEIIPMEGKR